MKKEEVTIDVLVADVLLRVQATQNLLIKRGIITDEEFQAELKLVSKTLLKSVLEKAGVAGDLDQLIEDLEIINKRPPTGN